MNANELTFRGFMRIQNLYFPFEVAPTSTDLFNFLLGTKNINILYLEQSPLYNRITINYFLKFY